MALVSISGLTINTDGDNYIFYAGHGSDSEAATPITINVLAGSLALDATGSEISLSGLTVYEGAVATVQSGKGLDLYTLEQGSIAPYGTLNITNDVVIVNGAITKSCG